MIIEKYICSGKKGYFIDTISLAIDLDNICSTGITFKDIFSEIEEFVNTYDKRIKSQQTAAEIWEDVFDYYLK